MEINITKLHREQSCIESIIKEELYNIMLERTDLLEYYTPIITETGIQFKDISSKIEFYEDKTFSFVKINIDNHDDISFIRYLLSLFNEIFNRICGPSLFNFHITIYSDYDLSDIDIPFSDNKIYTITCKSDILSILFNRLLKIRVLDPVYI